MDLRRLALLVPPIRRLHEDRARLCEECARLTAKLQEERTRLTAKLQEERAGLTAQLQEERARLTTQLREERTRHAAAQPMARLLQQMEACGIDLVLDVGANKGQFAQSLRSGGFRGEIVSFEPLSIAFAVLQRHCDEDDAWSCINAALGDADGEAEINISANSYSSSLLPVRDWTVAAEPGIAYVAQEPVSVRRLDGLLGELPRAKRIFLKVDTQGFDHPVIEGATGILDRIVLVQTELAWTPAYDGQAELGEMLALMSGLGFEPVHIMPGWVDKTGFLREVDVVFAREGEQGLPGT